MMNKIIIALVFAVEVFALANRGGGPLLSHLVLTGATFLTLCVVLYRRRPLHFEFHLSHLWYFLFFGFFLISLITSLTPNFGLNELLLFANAGILSIVIANTQFSERDLQFLCAGLVVIATVDVLIGYYVYTQTPFPRFAGTFLDLSQPYTSFGNDFANFLLLIVPIAIFQLLRKNGSRRAMILYGGGAAIMLSGFLLSFSRAALLSLLLISAVSAVWFLFKKQNIYVNWKKVLLRLGAVIILAAILMAGLQSLRATKFETTSFFDKATFNAHEGGASAAERFEFWKGATLLMGDHSLFGSGILSFRYLYPHDETTFGIAWDHPHNVLLKIGVENGIFAMIFFALFVLTLIFEGIRFFGKSLGHAAFPLLFGACAALAHNMLDFNFIVSNFTLVIIFMSILLSYPNAPSKSSAVAAISQNYYRFQYALLLFLSASLVLLGLHEAYYNIYFKRGRGELVAGKTLAAISNLEKSAALIFPRDRVDYLTRAYEQQYQTTHDFAWRTKEHQLLLSEVGPNGANSVDAELVSRLGELDAEERNDRAALALFGRALELDPMNHFKYYYDYVELHRKKEISLPSGFYTRLLALLDQYKIALHENRHITILTDNPLYAEKLYTIFGKFSEKAELEAIASDEMKKFTSIYGTPTTTLEGTQL